MKQATSKPVGKTQKEAYKKDILSVYIPPIIINGSVFEKAALFIRF